MPQPPTEPRAKRQLFVAAAGVTVVMAIVAVWIAVHHVPWLGPRLHDIGVAIFGRTAMGWAERAAYTADDGWNKLWGIQERPEAYWNLPVSSASANASGAATPPSRSFPHSPGPMVHTPFSKDDGMWFPIVESSDGPLVFRLVLHPDGDRAESVVKVVAFDLKRCELKLAPGKALDKKAGGIAQEQSSKVIALLLAGQRASRAGFGVAADGKVLRRPKPGACVIRRGADAALQVGYWPVPAAAPQPGDWWMQTPSCTLESGELRPGIAEGAPFQGRRLLVGVSRDGNELLAGVAEAVSEATAARAMRHGGAWSAAMMDSGDGLANVVSFDPSAAGGQRTGKALWEDAALAGQSVGTAPIDATSLYVVRTGS